MVGVTGWHFHFIIDDQSHGGHVLGVAGKKIEAEVEHLDQVLVLHRCVEFLLQLPGNQLDDFEVTQIVVDVVEQQIEQHIQWRI